MLAETEAFTRRPIIFMDDHACTRRIFVSDAAMPPAFKFSATREPRRIQAVGQESLEDCPVRCLHANWLAMVIECT